MSTTSIKSFHYFVGKVRVNVQSLLDTLTELSRLLYLRAQSRSPRLVLCLHNTAFLHAMLCKEIIGQPEILTSRKFYGRYWHSLTAHAAKQSRIISGRSANTEEEERHFNTLQGITRLTNRRPGDIITPSLIRLQAEQHMAKTRQASAVKAQESQISKYYKALPPFPNTIIPHRYIVKNPKEYQAHLQSISDFLVCGEGVWWQHVVSGVEFLDGPDQPSFRPQGPSLHHFRSSDLKLEEQYLTQCWDMCLADEAIKIPHRVIRLYGDNGDCIQVIRTNFLGDDDDDGDDNGDEQEYDEGGSPTPDQQYEIEHCDDDIEEPVESLEVSLEEACPVVDKELGAFDDDECNEGLEIPNAPSLATPGEYQPLMMNSSELQNTPSNDDSTVTATPECKEHIANKHDKNSSPECHQPQQIATKLCKNIARILGETDDVHMLDQARNDLQCHPTSNFYQDKYQNLLVQMQTKILAEHTSLKKEHNNWEKEYCLKHDFHVPDFNDVKKDKRQYSIYKKIVLCKELLKHWKITVHL